jgi:peptidyl-prolyl cis-trans isomerase SurA
LLRIFLLLALTLPSISIAQKPGKLLDKIMAVVDDKTITFSMAKRVQSTLKQRKLISPLIYTKEKMPIWDVVQIMVDKQLIKAGLKEVGFIINDDQVEASINTRQKQLGVDRDQLIAQLRQFNISFDEYFELIRESIEYNLFNERVVRPLVNVTDQEIKNRFFENGKKKNSVTMKYKLVDFSVPKKRLTKSQVARLHKDLLVFRKNGILPAHLKNIEPVDLGEVKETGLNKETRRAVKSTKPGEFTKAVLIRGEWHSFFVKDREYVESSEFLQSKQKIKFELELEAARSVRKLWLKRESNNHFIKYFR